MPALRILLVEDAATTRDLLTHIPFAEGYVVDSAPTAAAAVMKLGSVHYSLVIADWVLPDGNGIDITDRAAQLGARTIIMSGYLFRLPAGGADRHQLMTKPFRPGEIVAAVRWAIGGLRENA